MHYFASSSSALKSVIWYDPQQWKTARRPQAAHLTALTGAADGADRRLAAAVRHRGAWVRDSSSSGWPAPTGSRTSCCTSPARNTTTNGAGTLPWTSEQVVRAWQAFGEIANTPGQVHGGTRAELLTNYGRPDSRCSPTRRDLPGSRGSFITASIPRTRSFPGSTTHPQPGTDFSFVPFLRSRPRPGTEEVAGDLLGISMTPGRA